MSDSSLTRASSLDAVFKWYETQPWLRALVQLVPVAGGSTDTILAWRGTTVAQRRFEELIADVSRRLEAIETGAPAVAFLESEAFIELFQSVIEATVRTSSVRKRALAAQMLSGTVRRATITDLTQQVARDLQAMDDVHLQVLSALPDKAGLGIDPRVVPIGLQGMPLAVYGKIISDLERLGFVRFDNMGIGQYGGGTGEWVTTDYIETFLSAVST